MLYLNFLSLFLMTSAMAAPHCPFDPFIPNGFGISLEAMETVQPFQKDIVRNNHQILKDPKFQTLVSELQNKDPVPLKLKETTLTAKADLYVFVSFSMGDKALMNLADEAKRYKATLVLRGFKDGRYLKTAQALQNIITKTGQGFVIDPELFSLFNTTAVPTFVLAKPFPLQAFERTQTPLHDRLQGHVSLSYALEAFSQEGDLKNEAKALFRKGEKL